MFSVGSGLDDSECIPYVSEHTDCTDANACSGCTRCDCNEAGKWECQKVFECPQEEDQNVNDEVMDNVLDMLYEGLEENEKKKRRGPGALVPAPRNPDEDLLLVPGKKIDIEEELKTLIDRQKRSVHEDKNNATVKFYETVDELNEDTLRNSNYSGTLEAQKVDPHDITKTSRRTDNLDNSNVSDSSSLNIEYNKPHELEHHIAENKIDSKHPPEDKIDGLSHEEVHKILGNYSQIMKDKELSKLVVNELTRGTERIGDKNVVPVSNITFTPENDTLTAMTFIAGNLLNKIWDMEMDATEGSYETEVMKHEKINDLLELFKEPLSIRQEVFLKNALEKLAHVIDSNKDTKNISLCANIEDSESNKPDDSNCTEKSKMENSGMSDIKISQTKYENKNKPTAKTINKVNDVLSLMQKYDNLQKKISEVKNVSKLSVRKSIAEENLSGDKNKALNIFGKLLEKTTKLISPNKNDKKITKRIQTYNMLRKDEIAKKNVENLFDINLANRTLSAKDKMITDYLSNIERHPNCFFSHLKTPVVTSLTNVEGSILYNLSEFFKIKSFTDLLKMVNDKPDIVKSQISTPSTTTTRRTSIKHSNTTVPTLRMATQTKNETLESVKEKLKNDIKNILQDLLVLQKEQGIKSKSNINIADALPCIYNILKSDNDLLKDNTKDNVVASRNSKIRSFIDALKLDMKLSQNRRSNTNIFPRPKSAIVWERTLKKLEKKYQKASRRYLRENPKTYKELKEIIDKVELATNTYKHLATQRGVAPSERLILLKTLQADVKQYMNVLEAINKSLTTVTNLPSDQQNEFNEFVENAAININLNKKLVALVNNSKDRETTAAKPKIRTIAETNQPLMMIPKWIDANANNNFKVNREQIMNQLIMNRLRLYIKTKERTEDDLNENANYNIAKRILFHLENGNVGLAKELYKVFLANKQHSTGEWTKSTEYHEEESLERVKVKPRGPMLLTFKEPLVEAEDAKKLKLLMQDYFLKQLLNLKGLKE